MPFVAGCDDLQRGALTFPAGRRNRSSLCHKQYSTPLRRGVSQVHMDPYFWLFVVVTVAWLVTYLRMAAELARVRAGLEDAGKQAVRTAAELATAQSEAQQEARRATGLQQDLTTERETKERLTGQLATTTAALHHERSLATERQQATEEARTAMHNQFRVLAQAVLDEKARSFAQQSQVSVGQLLQPLTVSIGEFKAKVQETLEKDAKERGGLEAQLKQLQEAYVGLNQEAANLTRALTGGNQNAQGTWGELVLERVLERSGLRKDHEYRVQVSDTVQRDDASHRVQPDVIVDLPEGKHLIIDAKVSLNAYSRYAAATDDTVRQQECKAHVDAVRQHIRSLAAKHYERADAVHTLDFVFLFMAVEPAYLLALQHDPTLFEDAFARRILLAGPSTLLAMLRTVASIWRYEQQNQNALEIARQSGDMLDKFAGFAEDFVKIGQRLEQTHQAFVGAQNKLTSGKGNLMARAGKLKQLGVKHTKDMPALPGYDPAAAALAAPDDDLQA